MAQTKTSKETTPSNPANPFTSALDFSTEFWREQMQRMETLQSSLRALETENLERTQRCARALGTMFDQSIEYANQLASEWRQTVLSSFAVARASVASFATAGK